MGAVEPLDEPAGWDELGCHPDRPVAHLSVGNPHSVVGVDDVGAVDLLALGSHGAARQPRDRRARARAERDHDARPRTRRRHHRGVRHRRRAPRRSPPLQWGLVPASLPEIVVHMDGGSAKVAVDRHDRSDVTLTGPATYVGTIEIEIETDIT